MNTSSKRDWRKKTQYSHSRTIPGQSLIPAELLKRHLAGTLPDIDLSTKYEYHYDEEGNQINEPLPLEMHQLHTLAVALRQRQFEAATEHRKKQAEKERAQIIKEYLASQAAKEPNPASASPEGVAPSGDQPL